jgi:hypothetical protein
MAKTDIQESAQALFCALANVVGRTNINNVFNKTKYPTYFDFKTYWDNKYTNNTLEKVYNSQKNIKTPGVKFSDIEKLLNGIGESKKEQHDWYYSSLQIAKQLLIDVTKISSKFSYVSSGDISKVFWFRGDPEVMDNIAALFKKANDYQKLLILKTKKTNISRPFDNINKWSTADIYFASPSTKMEIAEMVKLKQLDFTTLNSFVSKKIAEGTLLPLSLKKQPDSVKITKVNFNRPQEQKDIEKLVYAGTAGASDGSDDGRGPWVIWDEKIDIKKYARTLIVYMSSDKKLFMQLRHDISTASYKIVIQYSGSKAFEGSVGLTAICDIMKTLGSQSFSDKLMKEFDESNAIYRKKRDEIEKMFKGVDNSRYNSLRGEQSAKLITNKINPQIIKWLNEDRDRANLFVRAIYTYATARSTTSSKYIIAK